MTLPSGTPLYQVGWDKVEGDCLERMNERALPSQQWLNQIWVTVAIGPRDNRRAVVVFEKVFKIHGDPGISFFENNIFGLNRLYQSGSLWCILVCTSGYILSIK